MELVSLKWYRLASNSPYLRPRHVIYRFTLDKNKPLCRSVAVVEQREGKETYDFPVYSLVDVPVTAVPHYLRFEDVTLHCATCYGYPPVNEQNRRWLHALDHW